MNQDRWEDINRILDALFDLEEQGEDDVEAALDRLCGGDAELRQEVEAALATEAPTFLDRDAADLADTMIQEVGDRPPAVAEPGAQVGPYRLVREIGRGGMGVVYLAARADGQFERDVALKLLPRAFESTRRVARFRAERQILASLTHPSIAGLLDGGVTDTGRPFLVMEYVDGVPITDYCATHGCTVETRLRLMQQVCAAVQHAHRRLVVHRDLKPGNILVAETPEGPQVKLLDFGIAKLLDEEAERLHTRTGERMLTPQYAAPEQVRGEAITTATDVYQLGVLAYELLAGERPFSLEGKSLTEIEQAILNVDPDPPSTTAQTRDDGTVSQARNLRGDLDTIVLKALRKEPERRYGSVEAFQDDVGRYLDGKPILARPTTLTYRVRKFVTRNPASVAASGLVVLLLIAYVSTVTVQNQRIAAERDRARVEARTSAAVTDYLVDLFEANDPVESAGDTLTAPELLARGVERADRLTEEPKVHTQLLRTMGRAYRSLGDLNTADSLLQAAFTTSRDRLGRRSLESALTAASIASVRNGQGRFADADSLLTYAIDILEDEPEHMQDRVEALVLLGDIQQEDGRYKEAEATLQQAIELAQRDLPEPDLVLAGAMNNLAVVYGKQRRLEKAEALFRKSLEIERGLEGIGELRLASTMTSLAVAHLHQKEHAEAEALLRDVLAVQREQLPPRHPKLLPTMNNLAVCLEQMGAYDEAMSFYRETLTLARSVYGEVHPAVASTLSNVASLNARRGNHAEAEAIYRQVLDLDRQILPEGHSYIGDTYMKIGLAVAAQQGRFEEAEANILRGWRIFARSQDPSTPIYQQTRAKVADFYRSAGRLEEAQKYMPDSTQADLPSTPSGDESKTAP